MEGDDGQVDIAMVPATCATSRISGGSNMNRTLFLYQGATDGRCHVNPAVHSTTVTQAVPFGTFCHATGKRPAGIVLGVSGCSELIICWPDLEVPGQ